jgi:transketolase
MKSTRDGFGEAIIEIAKENEKVVVLSADLSESLRLEQFKKEFPDRFIECGVAEQNMMGVAAGLALAGKIPVVTSFAAFNPGRNLDQLRLAAYSNLNIKVIGGHAGLLTGEDGATHQALEDLAITSSLPNMTVFVPTDFQASKDLTKLMIKENGPSYLRLGRAKLETITDFDIKPEKIKNKKARVLKEGKDLSIIACGFLVQEALKANAELEKINLSLEIIDLHTIKDIDKETIINSAKKTGAVIVAAEHQINSGPTTIVSQLIAESIGQEIKKTVLFESIGVEDKFGESGTAEKLISKYRLDYKNIIRKVKKIIEKKKKINS